MTRLRRQAILVLLVPISALLVVGLPYALSGRLSRVLLEGGFGVQDLTISLLLFFAFLIPPLWGYRVLIRVSQALTETSEVVRRVSKGDFSQIAGLWSSETSELLDLGDGIDATAGHLQSQVLELNEEKRRLEAILSNMAEGVLLLDQRKRVILMNPAAAAMFGTNPIEATGRDHLEITHHFDLDELISKVLGTGQSYELEIKRAKPDERVLGGRLVPVGDGADHERSVLLVLRDNTRFRRLEQVRTDFFANVTHELRTPLTGIRGFAETLLEGALDDPETARHFVTIIKKEGDQLGRLIEDILDLSRIESGKWTMKRESVYLDVLVRETANRLAAKGTELGVSMTVSLPPEIPPIPGDADRLAQVFINLVENALKYTPAGGTVTISALDRGDTVAVSVADTGVGIPKADLPRIFERFYRVDKARTRRTGGTGLGLSIVRHIVESHGGSISVTSEVGIGSTLVVCLPKHHPSQQRS
jgi:two-component system phosphate regulon sensor histidine kinase PhoR